jgi:hypothetical protein
MLRRQGTRRPMNPAATQLAEFDFARTGAAD